MSDGKANNTGENGKDRNENSYGTIVRRLSAFGGVQVFNVFLTLIRGKFVALFLGTAGMGINSMYTTSANALQLLGSMGLGSVLVKEVAAAKEDGARGAAVMAVVRKLILLTSCLGALLCFFLAPLLSRWSFGNGDYTYWFMLLSVFVGLGIGGSGYLSILQGAGEVKNISKASIVGGLTGLVVGVPLYWLYGVKGIVPAMIALSLAVFLFYYITCRRTLSFDKVPFRWREHKKMVMRFILLGVVLMAGTVLGSLTSYLINSFIRYVGSIEDVGLFQAANSMTTQYVGILFNALAMDYFPRLSKAVADNRKMRMVVNRQVEVVCLVGAPLTVALILTAPILIRVLLTEEFLSVVPLLRWMGLGLLLQMITYPLGYVYVAKGHKKLFFWTQAVASNAIWFVCSAGLYYNLGLVGLGVSLVIRGVITFVFDLIINSWKYGFGYSAITWRETLISIGIGTLAFVAVSGENTISYILTTALLVISSVYSILRLRKSMRGESA